MYQQFIIVIETNIINIYIIACAAKLFVSSSYLFAVEIAQIISNFK